MEAPSADGLALVGLLALAEGPVAPAQIQTYLRHLSLEGLYSLPPSPAVTSSLLEDLKDQGWLRPMGHFGREMVYMVYSSLRSEALELAADRTPRVLQEAARHLDPGPPRFTTDLPARQQTFLWALYGGIPARITEAGAVLDHGLALNRSPGDFAYTRMGGSHLVEASAFALRSGQWLTWPPERRRRAAELNAYHAVLSGAPSWEPARLAVDVEGSGPAAEACRLWAAVSALVAGRLADVAALSVVEGRPGPGPGGAGVLARWLAGDDALDLLEVHQAAVARARGTKAEAFTPGPLFPWLAALALASGRASAAKLKSFAAAEVPVFSASALILWAAFRHRGKAGALGLLEDDLARSVPVSPLDHLLGDLAQAWNGLGAAPDDGPFAEAFRQYGRFGALWYQAEVARLACRLVDPPGPWPGTFEALGQAQGFTRAFADLVDGSQGWRESLRRLGALGTEAGPGTAAEAVCWLLDPETGTVEACLRTPKADGSWSAPKKAPLTRLAAGDHPALGDADRPVFKHLWSSNRWVPEDLEKAWGALAGHPRLFLKANPDQPLTLEAADLELVADPETGAVVVTLSGPLDTGVPRLTRLGPTSWQVVRPSPEVRKVAEIIGPGLTIPDEGRTDLVEVLGRLAGGLTVRSPLLKDHSRAQEVAADPRPVVLLTPLAGALGVEVHVRPLGPGTALRRPGTGPLLVHARREGGLLTSTRNLGAEEEALAEVLASAPALEEVLAGDLGAAATGEDALALLADLRDLGDRVTAEWPQGGKIASPAKVGTKQLRVQSQGDQGWFAVGGDVWVDGRRVADFRELVNLKSPPGRFVALADGTWVELEAQVQRALAALWAAAEPGARDLRVARAAAVSLDLGALTEAALAPGSLEEVRHRWAEAPQAAPPATLNADLRPYQLEGFQWLARLADVGLGALLADDMGLGKTVQTIALLGRRARLGPALVVCPTSVAPHWAAEIRRFDPSLRPVLLAEGPREERHLRVSALGPGSVLIVTYGLLAGEGSLLAAFEWATAVLDEAQAVKNLHAQRTQAVLGLRAAFRLACTGTPVQNHLGDFWTLFQFLNPGLLGTLTRFRERFESAEAGAETARRALQHLIRPFVLRRTKNQVLTDLPSRTEMTLSVDLTPGERDWYEALRQEAVEALAAAQGRSEGERQILTLAHLMKLRRSCCHPRLAGGPPFEGSSKLTMLQDLLEGLLDGGHQVLVFSQFTDHLDLVEGVLGARGWGWERLDGSTPGAQRGALVARFQAGSAPIFLISLGAGGTGLNLTAADYVIHLDPWWNPAVEDQASDRAHRLGQTRPVTIYRLVAAETIEEKIVALHRTKRHLAAALLEGTDTAGRLGADELLDLISGRGLRD